MITPPSVPYPILPEALWKYQRETDVLGDATSSAQIVGLYGDEDAIVNAARVSYSGGTRLLRDNAGLVRYLSEHRHETPFEMPIATFKLKMPIFTARQHDRHRASSKNEESARYSVINDDFYMPSLDRFRAQSSSNKQGSADAVIEDPKGAREVLYRAHLHGLEAYHDLRARGVARETARTVLCQGTYTTFVWQTNLRMLLHYLSLRDDGHAQWEIRQYARFADAVVKAWVPNVHAAYCEFRRDALTVPSSAVGLLTLAEGAERPEGLSKRSWNALLARLA